LEQRIDAGLSLFLQVYGRANGVGWTLH